MDKIHGLASAIGFMLLIIGIMFMIFGKKSNEKQQSIAIGYVGAGIALILFVHFLENPDFQEWATAKVAIAAVCGIIFFLKIIGRRR